MKRRMTDEQIEFVGATPKNKKIWETVRRVGYLGVMLNNADFLDAVIWASNFVDNFEKRHVDLPDRIVVPLDEIGLEQKKDLENAYLLLIVFYFRRGELKLVELLKSRFLNLAKYQEVEPGHVTIMKNWDTYMANVKKNMDAGDFSTPEMGSIGGTRDIFDSYKNMVTAQQQAYKDEMRKESGLRVD